MHADTTSRTELEIGAKLGAIIQNATARERLVANPAEVLAEVGINSDAAIFADTADLVHLIIPAKSMQRALLLAMRNISKNSVKQLSAIAFTKTSRSKPVRSSRYVSGLLASRRKAVVLSDWGNDGQISLLPEQRQRPWQTYRQGSDRRKLPTRARARPVSRDFQYWPAERDGGAHAVQDR